MFDLAFARKRIPSIPGIWCLTMAMMIAELCRTTGSTGPRSVTLCALGAMMGDAPRTDRDRTLWMAIYRALGIIQAAIRKRWGIVAKND